MSKENEIYIKFTHDYPKLDKDCFTTIRRRDKGLKVGQSYPIKSPSKKFRAVLTNKVQVRLTDIPDNILFFDTNTTSREDAYNLLNSFYKNPLNPQEEVTLFYFYREGSHIYEKIADNAQTELEVQ